MNLIFFKPRKTTQSPKNNLKRSKPLFQIPQKDEFIRVCRRSFQAIFPISSNRLDSIISYQISNKLVKPDSRGGDRTIENFSSIQNEIILHIGTYNSSPSHYTSNPSNIEYLDPTLSISKMLQQFQEKTNENVSYFYFSNIFRENFNIKIVYLQIDTCSTCANFHVSIYKENNQIKKTQLQALQSDHLKEADFSIHHTETLNLISLLLQWI